jgi:hypothetical protein
MMPAKSDIEFVRSGLWLYLPGADSLLTLILATQTLSGQYKDAVRPGQQSTGHYR